MANKIIFTDLEGTEESTDELQDIRFNPWRIPKTDKAKALVNEAINQVQNYETYYKLRTRKRKQDDQERFKAAVSALVCNAAYHYLVGQGEGVYVTCSHKHLGRGGRYSPAAYTKKLPTILEYLASPELALIDKEAGCKCPFGHDKRTTIRAGERLTLCINSKGIGLEDLGINKHQEVIILKRAKAGYWDDGESLDYKDNDQTRLLREQVQRINSYLESADLEFDEMLLGEKDYYVDTSDRILRRCFTQGRFDRGGRLFGGFWQRLPSKLRRQGISIGGQDVVELDYGQMEPRILYGLCKAVPPEGDLYSVPGYEECRPGIKKVMNSMLFTTKRIERMPKGVKKKFNERCRVSEVIKAIENKHYAVKDKFFTGIGHKLQFIESNIMVDVLLELGRLKIATLPIHDSLIVPVSVSEQAKEVMLTKFIEHVGIEGIVSQE